MTERNQRIPVLRSRLEAGAGARWRGRRGNDRLLQSVRLAAWLADPDGNPALALDAGLVLAAEVVGRPGAR